MNRHVTKLHLYIPISGLENLLKAGELDKSNKLQRLIGLLDRCENFLVIESKERQFRDLAVTVAFSDDLGIC